MNAATDSDLGARFVRWAQGEAAVRALVAIGSRVREPKAVGAADRFSDWDFQVIASDDGVLVEAAAFERAGIGRPLVFVNREGRLGSARKLTALFAEGELDVVVIPFAQVAHVRAQVDNGTAMQQPPVARALQDLAAVLAGGYRFLKGEEEAGALYRFVRERVPLPRLDDRAAVEAANGFVCDYVSTRRKIERGERIAAQRWLHHQLAETNFKLLHELRLRAGEPSFPDARRIESLAGGSWAERVAVDAGLDSAALTAAAIKAAATCRDLMQALVGGAWRWPDGVE